MNGGLVPFFTQISRSFNWSEIGKEVTGKTIKTPYLDYDNTNKYARIELTLRIVDGLDSGPAQQTLLTLAVEKAMTIDTVELFSSKATNLLWKISIRWDDKKSFKAVADKCKLLDPSELSPSITQVLKHSHHMWGIWPERMNDSLFSQPLLARGSSG